MKNFILLCLVALTTSVCKADAYTEATNLKIDCAALKTLAETQRNIYVANVNAYYEMNVTALEEVSALAYAYWLNEGVPIATIDAMLAPAFDEWADMEAAYNTAMVVGLDVKADADDSYLCGCEAYDATSYLTAKTIFLLAKSEYESVLVTWTTLVNDPPPSMSDVGTHAEAAAAIFNAR